MDVKTPEEVLKSISIDLKSRGLTHKQAAKRLGYSSKQTVSNILTSKKYLSGLQARKFANALGYDVDYLMSGKGGLFVDMHETVPITIDPQIDEDLVAMILKPFRRQDVLLILYFFRTLFNNQKNKDGLALLDEVFNYINAERTARIRICERGITKTHPDYTFELNDEVDDIQCSILDKIHALLKATQ